MPCKINIEGTIVKSGDVICDPDGNKYTLDSMCGRGKVHVHPLPGKKTDRTKHLRIENIRLLNRSIEDGDKVQL